MANLTNISQITNIQKIYDGEIFQYQIGNRFYEINTCDISESDLEDFGGVTFTHGHDNMNYEWSDNIANIQSISEISVAEYPAFILYFHSTISNDCTEEVQSEMAEQKLQARKQFLSQICKNAWNRVKRNSLRWGVALRQAYADAKVALATVVEFFKISTGEITKRSVKFIQMLADGRYLFLDNAKNAPISFSPYQLLSYEI